MIPLYHSLPFRAARKATRLAGVACHSLFPGTYRFEGEFGYELIAGVPYAYYLKRRGLLRRTVAAAGTAPLYFFSPLHEELNIPRDVKSNQPFMPITPIHVEKLLDRKWCPPPYKERFRNDTYVFDRPTLVISNKYNSEWKGPPINFFDRNLLSFLFDTLSKRYTVIYNRYTQPTDNSDVHELDEVELIRKSFPRVLLMQELVKKAGGNWNAVQMSVYANTDRFISVQGGNSVLASYFGGDNCVYLRKGKELEYRVYERWYRRLSGCHMHTVPYEDGELEYEGPPHWKIPRLQRDIRESFKQLVCEVYG